MASSPYFSLIRSTAWLNRLSFSAFPSPAPSNRLNCRYFSGSNLLTPTPIKRTFLRLFQAFSKSRSA